MEHMNITQLIQHHNRPIVCIQTLKTAEDGPLSLDRTLNEVNPRYVILYHCNVSAVRQIEVYEARMKRLPINRLKVYFIMHAQTVEEQSYLTSLRREKQAFEMIIDTKAVSWWLQILTISSLIRCIRRKWCCHLTKMAKPTTRTSRFVGCKRSK